MSSNNDEYATLSVLSYLENEGYTRADEYLELDPKGRVGFPNYSDMIKSMELIGGTTREGIRFESTKVHRSDITTYLRERYDENVSCKKDKVR